MHRVEPLFEDVDLRGDLLRHHGVERLLVLFVDGRGGQGGLGRLWDARLRHVARICVLHDDLQHVHYVVFVVAEAEVLVLEDVESILVRVAILLEGRIGALMLLL